MLPPPELTPEFLALQQAVAGRYSLDRELGRGGMGVVFLARDVALDRPVAIKLLPPALAADPTARERFVREARTAARLSHPHIVPIHAVEERDGLVWFVMAFVDGETLGERVRRAGPLSATEALRVTQEVAWALGHAHAHGVVHRDVKPDNVLLERGSGRAMVTDFGIAHATAAELTPPDGTAAGTPAYMSPEQGAGERADARSDLYSLGVTAFYAATGRLPFAAPSAAAMLVKHATEPAPPLLATRPTVPPAFARAVDRCLAKDPAARWASADELAEVLRGARATRPELPSPVRRWLREADVAGSELATALTASGVSIAMVAYTEAYVDGWANAFAAVTYLSTAAVAAGLAKVRLAQLVLSTRALLRRGYGHDAARPALALDERARREEELDETTATPTPRERRGAMAATLAAGAAGTSLAMLGIGASNLGWVLDFATIAGSIAIPTVTIRRLWALRGGRSLWHHLLEGRLGRWVFRVAGAGQPAASPALPSGGEPTVLAVGRAADALFAALPDAQRARLGDVPALLARLEGDALAARADGADADPAAAARLESAVAAIEAIRLDLLRLQAGLGTLDDLTRDVEAARALGARVDAELAARGAAREELRTVLGREPTPV